MLSWLSSFSTWWALITWSAFDVRRRKTKDYILDHVLAGEFELSLYFFLISNRWSRVARKASVCPWARILRLISETRMAVFHRLIKTSSRRKEAEPLPWILWISRPPREGWKFISQRPFISILVFNGWVTQCWRNCILQIHQCIFLTKFNLAISFPLSDGALRRTWIS